MVTVILNEHLNTKEIFKKLYITLLNVSYKFCIIILVEMDEDFYNSDFGKDVHNVSFVYFIPFFETLNNSNYVLIGFKFEYTFFDKMEIYLKVFEAKIKVFIEKYFFEGFFIIDDKFANCYWDEASIYNLLRLKYTENFSKDVDLYFNPNPNLVCGYKKHLDIKYICKKITTSLDWRSTRLDNHCLEFRDINVQILFNDWLYLLLNGFKIELPSSWKLINY